MSEEYLEPMSPDSGTGEVFEVEEILAKRLNEGCIEYFVKWRDCENGETCCNWAIREALACYDMIAQFENDWEEQLERRRREEEPTEEKIPETPKRKRRVTEVEKKRNAIWKKYSGGLAAVRRKKMRKIGGFKAGMKPDKIIAAADIENELVFLMQWKNSDQISVVRARYANVRCPQIVIAYYEQRMIAALKAA